MAGVAAETQFATHKQTEPVQAEKILVSTTSMQDKEMIPSNESGGAEHTQADEAICDIRYTYDCFNYDGPNFVETNEETPLSLQVSEKPQLEAEAESEKPPRVFEIITRLEVNRKEQKTGNNRTVQDDGAYEEPSIKNMRVSSVEDSKMVIHSTPLIEAVRNVVEYYPSQNLLGDTVTIRDPYHVLLHHAPELKEYKAQLERQVPSDQSEEGIAETCRHIQVLLNFLEPKLQRSILLAKKRLQKDDPTVLFDDIWYLLRPGSLSYFTRHGVEIGCVIESVKLGDDDQWEIRVWFQGHEWDAPPTIGRAYCTVMIDAYDGEKRVTSLPAFPREYYDRKDGGQKRRAFESRGKKICDILWKGYSYMNFNGKLLEKAAPEYRGPIIVGGVGQADSGFADHEWEFDSDTSVKKGPEGLNDPKRPKESLIVNALNLDPAEHSRDLISDDHAFLLCPVMGIFTLRTKSWTCAHIDSMTNIGPPDKIPDADIGAQNLKMIKALSDRQTKSEVPWSADFIKEKGEGVVVLLHGPPGVGKTYTVETTALNTGRPLISLTIADLGTKEENIEGELTKWFTLAHKWRAIVLIDEADIFLERREHRDIARNGVVSAFLRKIEYFGGLLFLTTNRVGHIDEAFMSRVHVIIGFEKLSPDKRRAIWRSFLQKLVNERDGKIRVDPSACDFLLGDEMCNMDWNGREIRNAFQTAIALAEFTANESQFHKPGAEIIVGTDHFRKGDSQDDRANTHYGRNDYYREQNISAGRSQSMHLAPAPQARFNDQFVGSQNRMIDVQQTMATGMHTGGQYSPGMGAPRPMR